MTRTDCHDNMDVERGWCPVGFHHLPGFPSENLVVLLKKGSSYRSAVIREIDLPAMISDGILLEVRDGSQFCFPYIMINSGGS
jgi:hypothetical protein